MKLVDAQFRPYRLPLRRPLVTAQGTFRRREGLLLRLETQDGLVGWGEAAPLPGFSPESRGEAAFGMGQALALLQVAEIPARAAALPDFLDGALHEPLGYGAIPPSVRYAVELALLDLLAQRARCPLSELLSPTAAPSVVVSRLVRDPEGGREAVAEGLRSVKLKLSDGPVDALLAEASAMREAIGSHTELRVDANQAWAMSTARALLPGLAELGVACVEEPLREPSPEALASLRGLGVMIAADESLRGPADLDELLDAVDLIVLKPAFLGGLLLAQSLARRAAERGLGVVVTTALDAAVGRRGALHLAAALPPGCVRPCGLDTGGLLSEDLGPDSPRRGDQLLVGRAPGLGVEGLRFQEARPLRRERP